MKEEQVKAGYGICIYDESTESKTHSYIYLDDQDDRHTFTRDISQATVFSTKKLALEAFEYCIRQGLKNTNAFVFEVWHVARDSEAIVDIARASLKAKLEEAVERANKLHAELREYDSKKANLLKDELDDFNSKKENQS